MLTRFLVWFDMISSLRFTTGNAAEVDPRVSRGPCTGPPAVALR